MKMNDEFETQMKLNDLLLHAVEGDMTPAQIELLNDLIIRRPELAKQYLEFMNLYCELSPFGDIGYVRLAGGDSETQKYDRLLNVLGREEKQAESIQIETETTAVPLEKAPVRRSNTVRNSRQVKHSAAWIILSAAAILLLVLLLRISPPASVEVATLSNSLDAVFAGDVSYASGSRLSNAKDSLWLQKGVVTIEFDCGAEVVIEAPAEFYLNSAEELTLRYGRLYARVPERSKGFTIETPIAQIIDLGTEFAVKVDYDQTCEVHMIKGNASLIPGVKGQSTGDSRLLSANEATHVDLSGSVKEIPVKHTDFIRHIDAETGFIWRGEPRIDLADIVGGGNGFGNGTIDSGFDVMTGKRCSELGIIDLLKGTSHYQPVFESDLIDGVFTVAQQEEQVLVDSAGHAFDPGYLTEGDYWGYIMNGAFHHGLNVLRHTLVLDGRPCGTKDNPAIGIHPNMGITFDLKEIQKRFPGTAIGTFTAVAGISETVNQFRADHGGKVDAWVLLDGEVKFSKRMHWRDAPCEIELPIRPEDRFLTLIMTDGEDDDNCSYDWAMFVNPALEVRQDD
jgi:hypothetical protein